MARARIAEAKQLLTTTNTRIVDVGLAVGFNSLTHFGRVFKHHTGVTPLAYRQAILAGENSPK